MTSQNSSMCNFLRDYWEIYCKILDKIAPEFLLKYIICYLKVIYKTLQYMSLSHLVHIMSVSIHSKHGSVKYEILECTTTEMFILLNLTRKRSFEIQ